LEKDEEVFDPNTILVLREDLIIAQREKKSTFRTPKKKQTCCVWSLLEADNEKFPMPSGSQGFGLPCF